MPKKHFWTLEEDAFVLRNVNLIGETETARKLDVSAATLRKHLVELNISTVPVSLMVVPDYGGKLLGGFTSYEAKHYLSGVFDAGGKLYLTGSPKSIALRINGCSLDTVEYLIELTGMGQIVSQGKGTRPAYALFSTRNVLTFLTTIKNFTTSSELMNQIELVEEYCRAETQPERDYAISQLQATLSGASKDDAGVPERANVEV